MQPWTREKTQSLVKGLLIAAVGGAVTAATAYLSKADLGVWGPILGAALSSFINSIRLAIKAPDGEAGKESGNERREEG